MAETPTEAAPEAPVADSGDTLSVIDRMMAESRAALLPEEAAPSAEPAAPSEPREPAQTAQAADTDEEAAQEQESEGQATSDEPRFSRKDASRFYERAQKAEQQLAELQRQTAESNAARQQVLQKWGTRLGSAEERQRLNAIVADPDTDYATLQQARNRLYEINTASKELAPLYEAVQQDVFAHFSNGLKSLDTLPGVDKEAVEKLFAAKSGPEALKLMHDFATQAVKQEYEGQITALKTKIKELQTHNVANGPQPASGNGTVTKLSGFESLFGPDGLPTDKAIAMAKNGELTGLGAQT